MTLRPTYLRNFKTDLRHNIDFTKYPSVQKYPLSNSIHIGSMYGSDHIPRTRLATELVNLSRTKLLDGADETRRTTKHCAKTNNPFELNTPACLSRFDMAFCNSKN